MGRLPQSFGRRLITDREPWAAAGELILASAASGVFQENTFINNTDKPFEIHRMIPRATCLADGGTATATQPDQFNQLLNLFRIQILNLGTNDMITKQFVMIRSLVKGSTELTWEYAEPFYLLKGQQLQVQVQALPFPAFTSMANIRLELGFEGFFVQLGAPGGDR